MYNAPIVKKSFQILKLLVLEQRSLGVTEIAQSLSLNKSTVFGILRALEEEGYVVKDEATKKYGPGSELFSLSQLIFKRTDLAAVARPFLEKLGDVVDESVFLGVKEGNRVRIVDVVEAKKDLKISSHIGTKIPLTAGAVGKILFSLMKDEEIIAVVRDKGLRRFTENSITNVDLFMSEIQKTRRLGYSTDFEEYIKGVRAVATPILSGNQAVGALWAVGFTSSIDDEKLDLIIRQLKTSARLIGATIESQIVPMYLDNLRDSALNPAHATAAGSL